MEAGSSHSDKIMCLGIAYISFFQENPDYFQFLFYHSGVTIDLDNLMDENNPPFLLFKEGVYKMFQAQGMPEELYQKRLLQYGQSSMELVH